MYISEKNRQYLIENSVVAKMLDNISKRQHVSEALVFGCGTNIFPSYTRGFYPDARVIAYDIDAVKIAIAEQQAASYRIDELLVYTSERPTAQFEVVLASHVLHHDPTELAIEMVTFVKPGGLIGIVDYDMKGYSRDDFFARWGKIHDEKVELEKIGHDKAYQLHTTFGLNDCIELMQRVGVQHLNSQGKIASMYSKNLPTMNSYYVGVRTN